MKDTQPTPVIEASGLTKRYNDSILAVDQLQMRVRRGEVYGFVGPNGAGKTTTLRMLVGLIRPTAGSAKVLGHPAGSAESIALVGAMIEEPAFYPYLSGRENLRVMALYAAVNDARIPFVLSEVELLHAADRRFETYSTGMKQRLGIAAALLKDPRLLILDEPTNGLDPEGIADMRRLVRRLADGNRTVLLSSHLMTEVEQICDRIGVIRQGRLIAEGTLNDLRGEPELRISAAPMDHARELVASLSGVGEVRSLNGTLMLAAGTVEPAEINRRLVTAGVSVSELTTVQTSLEEIFLGLTHQSNNEFQPPANKPAGVKS
jgi:ABC-2 type transport system ATP-binding protein